jgi:hypothetical protein
MFKYYNKALKKKKKKLYANCVVYFISDFDERKLCKNLIYQPT